MNITASFATASSGGAFWDDIPWWLWILPAVVSVMVAFIVWRRDDDEGGEGMTDAA